MDKNLKKTLIGCSNGLVDLIYTAALYYLYKVCFDLFGWMIVNADKLYRSDIPTYIKILDDRPGNKMRLIYVVFRTCKKLTEGTDLGINICLALLIVLICLANHWFIRYVSRIGFATPDKHLLISFLSIAAIFTGPIFIEGIHGFYYMNTFPVFAWHSPTQILLTLFSVLATVMFIKMFDDYRKGISFLLWAGAAICFFLSAYSKPNYIIDMAPAVLIVFIIELFIKNELSLWVKFRRLFIIGCLMVPAGLYIIMFYMHVYKSPTSSADVAVAPVSQPDSAPPFEVVMVCSMLFAIIVILFNLKRYLTDRRYLLLLLCFCSGVLQLLLLSETGERAAHGNFSWGAMVGGFVLTLSAMSLALDNLYDKDFLWGKKWAKAIYALIITGALTAHLVSNITYFYTMYYGEGFWR